MCVGLSGHCTLGAIISYYSQTGNQTSIITLPLSSYLTILVICRVWSIDPWSLMTGLFVLNRSLPSPMIPRGHTNSPQYPLTQPRAGGMLSNSIWCLFPRGRANTPITIAPASDNNPSLCCFTTSRSVSMPFDKLMSTCILTDRWHLSFLCSHQSAQRKLFVAKKCQHRLKQRYFQRLDVFDANLVV